MTKTLMFFLQLPFAAMVFNCIGWTTYGFVRRDFFICFANWPGVVLGYFYVNTCLVVAGKAETNSTEEKTRDLIEKILVAAVFYWGLFGIIALVKFDTCIEADKEMSDSIIGISCVIFTIIYFASPLSTIFQVIKEKDSSSIYRPMLFCNFSNCLLWVLYGIFSTGDLNLILPNAIGGALAVATLFVSFAYPQKSVGEFVKTENLNPLAPALLTVVHSSKI